MSRTAQGGRIDRSRTLGFTFDGAAFTGHPGDTLASALLANGVHLMGRSFKYHRPRGVLGSGVEEPNALFGVTRGPGRFEPNQRATCVPGKSSMSRVSAPWRASGGRRPSPTPTVMRSAGRIASC